MKASAICLNHIGGGGGGVLYKVVDGRDHLQRPAVVIVKCNVNSVEYPATKEYNKDQKQHLCQT